MLSCGVSWDEGNPFELLVAGSSSIYGLSVSFSAEKHLPGGASLASFHIYFSSNSGLSAEGGTTEGGRNGIIGIKFGVW